MFLRQSGPVEREVTAWRLLKSGKNDAFTNMAIDEAIVTARTQELVSNTARLYQWKPSALSVGRFQDVTKEVQIESCRLQGINIVRRISGGGTVYHDSEGEVTYSVIAREDDFGTKDVVQAYNTICNGLIEAAQILGVKADFNPGDPKNCPNIAIQGKKISGSAQFHKGGVLLQHGTFLLEADLERMFTFLRVPWAKPLEDVLCVARERLTSVKRELGKPVSAEEAYEALVKGFEKTLNAQMTEEPLTSYEQRLAEELRNEKFSTEDWNFRGRTKLEP
jgi:lipoyltransferase/lipoate-protein ligase